VLELGVGTGRLAIPLAERGIGIHGIEISEQMVERLREKRGGEAVSVVVGDMADVDAPGPFALVYVAASTISSLLTQDDQVRCFENVAARLRPDGLFVVEAFVPDAVRFERDQYVSTSALDPDWVLLVAARRDAGTQIVDLQNVVVTEDGVRLYPVRYRYVSPAELDLMARLAGMRLRSRWASWTKGPFDSASTRHVSVYERRP
jgi:SAM-dependent methyltransferase